MNRIEEISNAVYELSLVIGDIIDYGPAIDEKYANERLMKARTALFNPAAQESAEAAKRGGVDAVDAAIIKRELCDSCGYYPCNILSVVNGSFISHCKDYTQLRAGA